MQQIHVWAWLRLFNLAWRLRHRPAGSLEWPDQLVQASAPGGAQ